MLVNRETNFNKVFNSTANVGVLNPLSAGSKVSYSWVPVLCVSEQRDQLQQGV